MTTIANDSYGFLQLYGLHTEISVPNDNAVVAGGAFMVHAASAAADSATEVTAAIGHIIGNFVGDDRAVDTDLDFWPGIIQLPR